MSVATIEASLQSGGHVTLTVDVDWLTVSIEDFTFVRNLAAMVADSNISNLETGNEDLGTVAPDRRETRIGAPDRRETRIGARSRAKAGTPKPPRKPKELRPGGGRYDYAVVAQVCAAAADRGLPMGNVLAEHYEVSRDMGRWLVQEARRRGYEIPERSTRTLPTGAQLIGEPEPPTDNAPIDYEAVAEVYRQAVTDHKPAIQAIADHFGVSHTTAKNWPGKCRELGLLPPRDQPQVPGDTNGHQVVQSHFASHSGVSVA